jgi:hypothetical protein
MIKVFLIFLIVFNQPALAYSLTNDPFDDSSIKLFVGYRRGHVIVGEITNIRVTNQLSLQAGVESEIEQLQGLGMSPLNVTFGFGVKYGSYGIYHDCAHELDGLSSGLRGYVRNRLYVDF